MVATNNAHAQLHILTHLDWEREGESSSDMQRAALLDVLSELLETLQNHASEQPHVVLAGQSIVLDEVAFWRPELLAQLLQQHRRGQIGLGPVYIYLHPLLSGGESLIRNLLLAREDAARYRVHLTPVAYFPHSCEHSAQLPQILRGFKIDAAFFCLEHSAVALPFRWEAPDGSSVLVMNSQKASNISQAIQFQQGGQPDGPFLWFQPFHELDALRLPELELSLRVSVQYSALEQYAEAVRSKFPDELRPTLKGEIHLHEGRSAQGQYSARIDIKQDMARLRGRLLQQVEPLFALAAVYGALPSRENRQALLQQCWRLLLQNQAPAVSSGQLGDAAYDDSRVRNRRLAEQLNFLMEHLLEALPGTPHSRSAPEEADELPLTVWNLQGQAAREMLRCRLPLPAGRAPAALLDDGGTSLPFCWDEGTQSICFLGDAPSFGYSRYTVQLHEDEVAEEQRAHSIAANSISLPEGDHLAIHDGQIDWTVSEHSIPDLLRFVDGGDAGDTRRYQAPQRDQVVKAYLADEVRVERAAPYERLHFRHRMRVAPRLTEGKSRPRGLRVLDLQTEASYYPGKRGLYFRTRFKNTAEDHRLLAHIRTGIASDALYTNATFGLVKHSISEVQGKSLPMSGVAALFNNERGLALFTRGLFEVTPLPEDGQITLALTLLRAVGTLDSRTGQAAHTAQMLGEHVMEFMLLPLDSERDPGALLRTAHLYQTPLFVAPYASPPPSPNHSYLRVVNSAVVVTSLKPPQHGEGLIVRLLNPTPLSQKVALLPTGTLKAAHLVNMAEEVLDEAEISENHVMVSAAPHQVVSVWLRLE